MNKYAGAFMSSPSPMFFTRLRDGSMVEFNAAFGDLVGVDGRVMAGRSPSEAGLVDGRTWADLMAEMGAGGRVASRDITLQTRKGATPFRVSGTILDDEGEKQVLWAGSEIIDENARQAGYPLAQFSVDHAPVSVFWVRRDASIRYVNETVCATLGYTREELESMRVVDLDLQFRTDDPMTTWDAFWDRVQAGGLEAVEVRQEAKTGEVIPVLVHLRILEYGGEELIFGFGLDLRDITRARAESQAMEEKFRSIFDQAAELMAVLAPDGTLLDVNETALRFLPSPADREALLGHPFWDTPWWTHGTKVQEELQAAVRRSAAGEVVRFRTEHPRDGEALRYVDNAIGPVLGEDGTPKYLVIHGFEITEQVRAETALKESEERARVLSENAFEGLAILDGRRIVEYNSTAADMFGYEVDEARGLPVSDFVCAEDRELVSRRIESAFSEPYEVHLVRRDGSRFPAEVMGKAAVHRGKPVRITAIRDVTESRSLQAQLLQAQKLDTLGTMVSGIAHDFNNLLVPIMGYADLLESGIPRDDPLCAELESHLLSTAYRARELVQQILTFSRKNEPIRKVLHLDHPVKQALRLVQATLPSTINLRARIDSDAGVVSADPTQVQQVVLNLCTNAAHAMEQGGGTLAVHLENVDAPRRLRVEDPEFSGGRAVRLTVRDTGEGILPEHLNRVFDPFFTTKAEGKGTGLGLSVVYGIVRSHEGVIEVDSRAGEGTCFRVFFPLVKGDQDAEYPQSRSQFRGTERILVVDDREESRETIRGLLESLGYAVSLAEGGRLALEQFRRMPEAFDLALIDYDMPGMTGTHLALELMDIRPDFPVVLSTGTDPTRIADAERLGARARIMKPFTAWELGKVLRGALAGG